MNPHPLHDVLIADRDRVYAAKRPDIEQKISSYTASVKEIEDWYLTHDPVAEELEEKELRLIAMGGSGFDEAHFDELNQKSETAARYEAAAFTLLVSIADPMIMEEYPDSWDVQYRKQFTNLPPFSGPEFLTPYVLEKIPSNLTEDQLYDLYIAIDCMHLSSSLFLNQATRLSKIIENGNEFPETAIAQKQCQDKADVYFPTSIDLISEFANRAKTSDNPESKKMALKTMMYGVAAILERVAAFDRFHKTDEAKQNLINAMQHATSSYALLIQEHFLGEDGPSVKVFEGSLKGDLHEAVFLLDMSFLLSQNQDILPDWIAKPTFLRMDKPYIGFPRANRGVDITLNNGSRNLLVQLKSGKEDKNKPGKKDNDEQYHPRTIFKRERNFQDVDTRRLKAKLSFYQKWADSDFDPAYLARIYPYVLESATETLEDVKAANGLPESKFLLQSLHTEKLSRADRRRIARRLGEFSSRKSRK